MYHIRQFSKLAEELTETVSGYTAADVPSVINTLEEGTYTVMEPVREITEGKEKEEETSESDDSRETVMGRRAGQDKKTLSDDPDLTESTDTESEAGEQESDLENENDNSESGELLFSYLTAE